MWWGRAEKEKRQPTIDEEGERVGGRNVKAGLAVECGWCVAEA